MYILLSIMFSLIPLVLIGAVIYWAVKHGQSAGVDELNSKIKTPSHLGLAIGIVIVALNVFMYDAGLGIGLAGFNLAIIISFLLVYQKRTQPKVIWILLAFSALIGLMFGLRANGFVQSIDALSIFAVAVIATFALANESIIWHGLWLIQSAWRQVIQTIQNIVLLPVYSKQSGQGSRGNVLSIIKTVAITFLVMIFFAELLAQADPVFAQIIQSIKDEAIGRTFVSIAIAIIILILFTVRVKPSTDAPAFTLLSVQDLAIPTIGVVLLFGIFIFIQAKYLFGGAVNIADFGLTYSEYTRKGFVELLTASFFGGVLAYLLVLKQTTGDAASVTLKYLNVILIAGLFTLLISALKRDLIYIDAYGLTRTRLIGGVILIWLTGFFTMLLARNFKLRISTSRDEFSEHSFWHGLIYLSLATVLVFNLVNVDSFIVNAETPRDFDNAKDYFYINNLSADAYNGWADSVSYAQQAFDQLHNKQTLTDSERKQLANVKLAMISLHEQREILVQKYGDFKTAWEIRIRKIDPLATTFYADPTQVPSDDMYLQNQLDALLRERRWQAFNLSEHTAYQNMTQADALFFGQVDCLISDIFLFQGSNSINLVEEESHILYETEYPFMGANLNYSPTDSNPYPNMYCIE